MQLTKEYWRSGPEVKDYAIKVPGHSNPGHSPIPPSPHHISPTSWNIKTKLSGNHNNIFPIQSTPTSHNNPWKTTKTTNSTPTNNPATNPPTEIPILSKTRFYWNHWLLLLILGSIGANWGTLSPIFHWIPLTIPPILGSGPRIFWELIVSLSEGQSFPNDYCFKIIISRNSFRIIKI